jgi:hypothetical protein
VLGSKPGGAALDCVRVLDVGPRVAHSLSFIPARRRKKAQVRQRPQYRKSAAQREGHGAAPAAMDAAGPAPGGSGIEAAHAPQDEDVVHSLSGLSVAAQAPRAVSFGRQAPGLELPRPNRSRAAGEGASKRANTGKEDMQCS